MAKKLFKNKPNENNNGVYHFIDQNDSTNYYDSDSVPLRYDKFVGKDLYSNSVGHSINEKIMDSKMQSANPTGSTYTSGEPLDALSYIGSTFVRLHSINIRNRGVNSAINDVYFRMYFFSKEYCNPLRNNGSILSYMDVYNCMHFGNQDGAQGGVDSAAVFFGNTGPNYGEGGAPGTSLFSNITIISAFDSLNYGPTDVFANGDGSILTTYPATEWSHGHGAGNWDPKQTLLKSGVDSNSGNPVYPSDDITTIFQEDGQSNTVYFGIHMDGDMDTTFDKSRNQTIAVYGFNPDELFNSDGSGKITTLEWDRPTGLTYSTDQDYTAAFDPFELSITINTQGGVKYEDNYFPPYEYTPSGSMFVLNDILPPLSDIPSTDAFDELKPNLESLILKMYPERQILNQPLWQTISNSLTSSFGFGGGGEPLSNFVETGDSGTYYNQRYTSKFADYVPISNINVTNRSVHAYYENKDDRVFASAPNTVNLDFNIGIHPMPEVYQNQEFSQYDYGWTSENGWDYLEDGITYIDKLGQPIVPFKHHIVNPSGGSLTETLEYNIFNNYKETNYFFLVVDWNDMDDRYKTIDDVLVDWPRTKTDLVEKRKENLFWPTKVGTQLNHTYSQPGIKTIKTIMCSYDDYSNQIEPLRWKLVTSRIFLDIPISEFPDFAEVGGADYTTIPWPYTTPVVGGVSQDSKYIKSINDTLSGGKVGDQDIIDETFLVAAQENDELGKNIEKMDLQQVRYFITGSYDMTKLLGIENLLTRNEPGVCNRLQMMRLSNFNELWGGGAANCDPCPDADGIFRNADSWISEGDTQFYIDADCSTEWGTDSGYQNLYDFDALRAVCDDGSKVTMATTNGGNPHLNFPGEFIYTNGEDACAQLVQFFPYTDISGSLIETIGYWDGSIDRTFPEESSVGQIFIGDNSDVTLKSDCHLEINAENSIGKSFDDSSGNLNKGLLIGDYKIKKTQKNREMKRDSYIKIPKKVNNPDGAI